MEKAVKLFLASGVKDDIGFWSVDYTDMDTPLNILGVNYLECYRNQIIGYQAAIEVKDAIKDNIDGLISEINKEGYFINKAPIGFSFDLPLYSLEYIFDFWLETYKNHNLWSKYKKLVKLRRKSKDLSKLMLHAVVGDTYDCILKIEQLYGFRPISIENAKMPTDFMW